jgi:hypothetical protein
LTDRAFVDALSSASRLPRASFALARWLDSSD